MANIILPAVPVLNEIDDSTKLLIEQAGEINRYPISDLDIGGGDVTIDLNSPGGSTNTSNPINADTLGGKPASDYILKDELILDGIGGGSEGDITIEIDPSAKEKPQSPLYSTSNDTHFYPLTTADQVILDDGNRLDDEISKYLTVELEGEAAEPNGINADTLGGVSADEFATVDDLNGKLSADKIVNNFTTTEEGFVADARALKVLDDRFSNMCTTRVYAVTCSKDNSVSPFSHFGMMEIQNDADEYGAPICVYAVNSASIPVPASLQLHETKGWRLCIVTNIYVDVTVYVTFYKDMG